MVRPVETAIARPPAGVSYSICWAYAASEDYALSAIDFGAEAEEGESVVPRFALHSRLRQSGGVLRTRLVLHG